VSFAAIVNMPVHFVKPAILKGKTQTSGSSTTMMSRSVSRKPVCIVMMPGVLRSVLQQQWSEIVSPVPSRLTVTVVPAARCVFWPARSVISTSTRSTWSAGNAISARGNQTVFHSVYQVLCNIQPLKTPAKTIGKFFNDSSKPSLQVAINTINRHVS